MARNIMPVLALLLFAVLLAGGYAVRKFYIIPERGKQFSALFDAATEKYGLPPGLIARQAEQESGFDPNAVNPTSGAQGLMQFMPNTAAGFHIDPFDPAQAIDAAGQYLSNLHKEFGSWSMALAAYNWGPGNLARHGFASAPKETRDYVAAITKDVGIV